MDEGPIAGYAGGSAPSYPPARARARTNRSTDDEDLEYRLAIEASKNEAEEDRKRRDGKSKTSSTADNDDDLAKAMKLSKEEEELRRRELENQNANSLFDDTSAQPQATGWNQGYQQQNAVDWFGNPMEQQQQQQQPQSTGYLNNAYSQAGGVQSQATGYQSNFGYNGYQQVQQNPYDQAQFQQPQQTSYMQPQQTAFAMSNPYNQQPSAFAQDQGPMQAAGSHNPWSSNAEGDTLKPQPTGSNNPFGASFGRQQPAQKQQQQQQQPTLSTLSEQRAHTSFPSSYGQASSISQQQTAQQQRTQNPQHAHLNALLSSGEGQDTFGNTGNMRIPAQHTAPGTFINSAGSGLNRLQHNQTGANPYLQSQYTGMPMQSQMMPAQTGPAGGYGAGGGYGSTNPFGQRAVSQPQPQGGSLIDF